MKKNSFDVSPYSLFPNRRERIQQRVEWILAVCAVLAMLWFCGWLIYQGLQVTNPLTLVYQRVVRVVSGGK